MCWHIKYVTRGKKGEEGKDLLSFQNKLAQLTKFQKSRTWVCGFSIRTTTLDMKENTNSGVTLVWQNTAVQLSRERKVFGVKSLPALTSLRQQSKSLCNPTHQRGSGIQ